MKNKKNIVVYGLLIMLIVITIYNIVIYNRKSENMNEIIIQNNTITFNKIEQILSYQYKDLNLSDRKIYLFINRHNFTCHICYEQLIKIINDVNSKYRKKAKNVIVLFPEDKEEGDYQKIKLKKWLEINNLSYSYLILKNELEDLSSKRSCLIIKKKDIIELNIPMSLHEVDRLRKIL